MLKLKRQLAMLTALTMLSTGTVCGMPKISAATGAGGSILEFAQKLSAQKALGGTENSFSELRYSEKEQSLYRDGKAVSGSGVSGFQVVNGALMVSESLTQTAAEKSAAANTAGKKAAAKQYVSLEDAKEKIGCEVTEKDGEVIVRSPFQSARLIVRSTGKINTLGATSETSGYRNLHVLQYETAADAYAAYQIYKKDKTVSLVEPDRIFYASDLDEEDQKYIGPSDRWGIDAIGADSYRDWLSQAKSDLPEIRVAVLDTGLYEEHEWMKNRVAENGASFVNEGDGSYFDDHGHGTHCAGIIVSSTLDNVKILPVKVLNGQGGGSTMEIYCGMMYAVEQGVDAASMSLGGFCESGLFNEGVQAFSAAGIPLAVAAGNESLDAKYCSPAMCPSAITVSAVGQSYSSEGELEFAEFSNYGKGIDFSAPGVDIESSVPDSEDATEVMSGTSMATPYVAACVADILSYNPDFTNEEIYDFLKANAQDLGEPGFDEYFGWGMVNLKNFRFSAERVESPIIEAETTEFVFNTVKVTLTAQDENAKIYYTLDGTDPSPKNGTLYDGKEITIDRSLTLRAVAVVNDLFSSIVSKRFSCISSIPALNYIGEYDYDRETDEPFIRLYGAQEIYFDEAYDISGYYYTTDGSEPTPENGTKIGNTDGIYIDDAVTIRVRALTANGALTDSQEYTFRVTAGSPYILPSDTENTIVMDGGQFSDAIYYTTDGSEPIPGKSPEYTGPLTFDQTTHVRAVSVSGKAVSSVTDYAVIVDGKDLPDSVEIKDNVLVSYRGILSELDFSKETFTEIGKNAFEGNQFAEKVLLPDTCTKIGDYAFQDAAFIREIKGGSVTEIGEGCFMNAKNLEELDAVLTDIPAKAFYGSMMPLKNAAVKTIGDYAFFNNPYVLIEENIIDWTAVESIGDFAFSCDHDTEYLYYDLRQEGELDLKSLKRLGTNVFEGNYMIKRVSLPDTMTSLPDFVFKNTILAKLKAAGLTELGEESLAFTPEDAAEIAIDFSKIQKIGPRCFSGFNFTEDVEFTALTEISEDGFAFVTAESMTFPAVKVLKTNTFNEPVYVGGLYFEHLETMESACFTLGAENEFTPNLIKCLVFGSELKTVAEDAFYGISRDCITCLACPPDSILYVEHDYLFPMTTPGVAVFIDQASRWDPYLFSSVVPKFGSSPLRAYPLGFDLDIRWYEVEPDSYDGAYGGKLIEGADSLIFYPDTSEAGRKAYAAAVVKDGKIISTSESKVVDVIELPSSGKLTTNETTVLEYGNLKQFSGKRYLSYTYTPETDGIYNFRQAFETVNLTVMDADNQVVTPEHLTDWQSKDYTLKGGVEYTVILPTELGNDYDYIRIIPAAEKDSVKGMDFAQIKFIEDSFSYEGKPVEPEFKVLYSEQYEFNPETETTDLIDPIELVKDKDYVIRYEDNECEGVGMAYAIGIGDYCGSVIGIFDIFSSSDYYKNLPELKADQPVEVTCKENVTKEFVVKPDKDGSYMLRVFFTPERLAEVMDEYGNITVTHDARISVFKVTEGIIEEEPIADDDDSFGMAMPVIESVELEKGETYVVKVITYYDSELGPMEGATLEMKEASEEFKSLLWSVSDETKDEYIPFDGTAHEPDLRLIDVSNEKELVKGEDYDCLYFNNVEPGEMSILACGIGEYSGYCYFERTIGYDYDNTSGTVKTIEPEKPFTLDTNYDMFYFDVEEEGYYTLDIPEGAEFEGVVKVNDSFFDLEFWGEIMRFNQDTFNLESTDEYGKSHVGRLIPYGKYFIAIRHEGDPTELTLRAGEKIPNIVLADINDMSYAYTGEPIVPEVTLIYEGVKLVEGVDYELTYPEDMVECGEHLVKVRGIGDYVGEMYLYVTIYPVKSLAEGQQLEEGRTAAEITKEHRVQYYAWTPESDVYQIWSDTLLNKTITVYADGGDGVYYQALSMSGVGYLSEELFVEPGTSCIVTASYVSENQQGDLVFNVSGTTRNISECTVEGEELIHAKTAGSYLPDIKIMDGDTALTEGVDYQVQYNEGASSYGRARIVFKGIGKYCGVLMYDYYIAPNEPIDALAGLEEEELTLVLDNIESVELDLPGAAVCYRFTAPEDGTYYLRVPEPQYDGATVFVYNSKLEVLPMDTKSVELKKDDWIVMLGIQDFAETEVLWGGYDFGVLSTAPDHYETIDDIYIMVESDGFTVVSANFLLDRISIPDTFHDEVYGIDVPFKGIDEDFYKDYGHPVIFCEKDSLVGKYCMEGDFNGESPLRYVLTDSVSTVAADVNGDEMVDDRDAEILQRWMTEQEGLTLPDYSLTNGDVNGDGFIDILDTAAIMQSVAENGVG